MLLVSSPVLAGDFVGGWKTDEECPGGDHVISFVIIERATKATVTGYVNGPERQIIGGSFDGKRGKFSLRYEMPTGGTFKQDWSFQLAGDSISGKNTDNMGETCTFVGERLEPMN